MSGESSIEWTDATWNPVRGCSRVSEGCRNCYAERVAARFSTHAQQDGDTPGGTFAGFAENTKGGPRWTGKVELIPHLLDWPLRRREPARIFVNSMSDLFHESLSNEAIAAVFGVMAAAPQHTFQILTKRPERMRVWFEWAGKFALEQRDIACAPNTPRTMIDAAFTVGGETPERKKLLDRSWAHHEQGRWPLPNVWLGVSVENQETADERIPQLLQTPAAVRFVSYEPALGPVDFDPLWLRASPSAATASGLFLDGQKVYYLTDEEQRAKFASEAAERSAQKETEFEANREETDRRIQDLPEVFRQRIYRFQQHGGRKFRVEFEPYELFVCEQAVLMIEEFSTVAAIDEFKAMPWEAQLSALPGLSDQHSGNTFDCAVVLAKTFKRNAHSVVEVHGALTPLVGCVEYGCHHE